MSETKIITSQYIEIEQTPAGVGERIFARVIDYIIIFLYMYGMFHFFDRFIGFNGGESALLTFFAFYLPAVFYSLLWEVFNNGRSPGKMLFKMRVVMQDGSTPDTAAYFMRWILLFIDVWMSWIGILVILLNKNNQRFGDIAAGTMVIKERDYKSIHVSLDEYDYLSKNYRPVFPQAENLSLEQVNTLSEALARFDSNRHARITLLTSKVKDFLKINTDIEDTVFLSTLLRDYQYFALEEI
ncbi:MAG: RDD family protein [Tannerella sp.]|nr:RDD family protein [Tannerella sp.]